MAKARKTTTEEGATQADTIPQSATSKLRKLIIQNFGCIGKTPVEVDLDEVVVLVGPNNAGKSTVLRAYKAIVESSAPKLALEDFHKREVDSNAPPTIELHTAINVDLL